MSGQWRWKTVLAAAWLVIAPVSPALGQAMHGFGDGDRLPLEVEADHGIEWQQDAQVFIARGNAVASRGDTRLRADLLKAFYRRGDDGATRIFQIAAEGAVRVSAPDGTATGQHGVYYVDEGVAVLGGNQVRLVSKQDTITADRQIEYWDQRRMAVARGNATAVRGDRRLRADVLVAHLRGAGADAQVRRVDAYDDIRIVTERDEITADRGVYQVETGIVTLSGTVTLRRGQNRLTGCGATVNLKTGVSRMESCAGDGATGRVRGVLAPEDPRQ